MVTLSTPVSTTSLYSPSPHTVSNRWNTPTYQADTVTLLNQLTHQLTVRPNGILNPPKTLLKQIIAQGKQALPGLNQFWQYAVQQGKAGNLRPALAGLLATEELLEHNVPEAEALYPLISQLDHIHNPLLTIYMAGVYGEMQRPEPYGWALWKLQQDAVRTALLQQYNPFAQPWPDALKVHEELGKVIMKHQTPGIRSIHQLEHPPLARNETMAPTGNLPVSPA